MKFFVVASFIGSLFATQLAFADTVFYYTKSKNGSLSFTDEPPPVARTRGLRAHAAPKKYVIHNQSVLVNNVKPAVSRAVWVKSSLLSHKISKKDYRAMIERIANEHRVEPALIEAIVRTESAYNARAVSHKGARGLMQLMPQVAENLGVEDVHDPEQNIRGGTQLVKQLLKRYKGNLDLTLAAYNAGDVAVAKHKGVPPYPETIDYIARVRKYYEHFATQP